MLGIINLLLAINAKTIIKKKKNKYMIGNKILTLSTFFLNNKILKVITKNKFIVPNKILAGKECKKDSDELTNCGTIK